MSPTTLVRAGVGLAVTVSAVGACSAPEPASDGPGHEAPGFEHIHALEVDSRTGTVYAATHTGVWNLPHPYRDDTDVKTPTLIGEGRQDTMGLTLAPDGVLYASGHPGAGEAPDPSAPVLGLIRSDDGAATWEEVSLRGEVDFHALATTPLDEDLRILGLDSVTSTVLVSDDAGSTWTRGAAVPAHDLEILADPKHVPVTTPEGPQLSVDAGRTFSAVDGAPLLVMVEAAPDGGVVGIDTSGKVWAGSADLADWSAHGTIPGESLQAMTYAAEEEPGTPSWLLIATGSEVVASTDLGATWDHVADTGHGAR
jgi:hypothetical protein